MRRFFKSTSFKIFIVIIAALLVGTTLAAVLHGNSSPSTSVTSTVFGPVQRFSSFIAKGLSNFSLNFRSSAALSKEVEKLENKILDLQSQLIDYEQAKQKLVLYEEFLELKQENPDFKFAEAAVIGRDAADVFSSFVLNKGTIQGVKVNCPVIYGKYLVGVVASVTPTQCTVNTILNPGVNISAYEIRTKDTGFITTDYELATQGMCKMPGLESTTAISLGGLICTSGVGGIYPRGLIIGTVTKLQSSETDISVYALVEPSAPFEDIKDVFIITSFSGQRSETENGAEEPTE